MMTVHDAVEVFVLQLICKSLLIMSVDTSCDYCDNQVVILRAGDYVFIAWAVDLLIVTELILFMIVHRDHLFVSS